MTYITITIGGKLTKHLKNENELLGCICSYISLLTVFQDIPDVEISKSIKFTKLPNDIISIRQSIDSLNVLYNNLQHVDKEYIEIIPLDERLTPKKFNIDPKCEDFMMGYYELAPMINEYYNMGEIDYSLYNDEFPPDYKLLNTIKLIGTPIKPLPLENKNYNFHLKIPAYLWTFTQNPINTYFEQITSNLINLFIRDCSDEDHKLLLTKEYYLRFLQYQDGPNTSRYAYGYLRKISDCTYTSHKDILKLCPLNMLPCEINTASNGYFYRFPVDEWINKKVIHVQIFD